MTVFFMGIKRKRTTVGIALLILMISIKSLCIYAASDNADIFREFLDRYAFINPGFFETVRSLESDSETGWCDSEGVLGYVVDDFNGNGVENCILVYIASERIDETVENHSLHIAVLDAEGDECKVTCDVKAGVFDQADNVEEHIYMKTGEEEKYLVLEQILQQDQIMKKYTVMHIDSENKLIVDMILAASAREGSSITKIEPKETFRDLDLAFEKTAENSIIYSSGLSTEQNADFGLTLNQSIIQYGLYATMRESVLDHDTWLIYQDDSMLEVCYFLEKSSVEEQEIRYKIGYNHPLENETAAQYVEKKVEKHSYNVEQERLHIVDVYEEVNNHFPYYTIIDGYPDYLVRCNSFLNNKNEDICWVNSDGNLRRQECHANDLTIEVYHETLDAIGKTMKDTVMPEDSAVFIFSYTQSGKEYRIYFKQREVIRYIGPDCIKHDYPEGMDLNDFCKKIRDGSSDGDAVSTSINKAFPGWWVSYESPE